LLAHLRSDSWLIGSPDGVGWKGFLYVVVTVEGESDLLHVIATAHAAAGFASGLNSGQQQCYKNANNRDYDQQLNERKARSAAPLGKEHKRTPEKKPEKGR